MKTLDSLITYQVRETTSKVLEVEPKVFMYLRRLWSKVIFDMNFVYCLKQESIINQWLLK